MGALGRQAAGIKGAGDILVSFNGGTAETYSNVDNIYFEGGVGNDTLTVASSVTKKVIAFGVKPRFQSHLHQANRAVVGHVFRVCVSCVFDY